MNELGPGVRRALASHFVYLDELLGKMQVACGVTEDSRLFHGYELDVPSTRLTEVLEGIARIRQSLESFSTSWGLDLPAQPVFSSHALKVGLQFLDIALDEMSPRTLSGYGASSQEFASDYRSHQESLRRELHRIAEALVPASDGDSAGQ